MKKKDSLDTWMLKWLDEYNKLLRAGMNKALYKDYTANLLAGLKISETAQKRHRIERERADMKRNPVHWTAKSISEYRKFIETTGAYGTGVLEITKTGALKFIPPKEYNKVLKNIKKGKKCQVSNKK